MKDSYPDIQADSLEMASEPIVVYGDSITSSTERIPSISVREQILAKTVSVDKYFDELISQVREYALDRDMTPEQLYAVISEEIDDIYANG